MLARVAHSLHRESVLRSCEIKVRRLPSLAQTPSLFRDYMSVRIQRLSRIHLQLLTGIGHGPSCTRPAHVFQAVFKITTRGGKGLLHLSGIWERQRGRPVTAACGYGCGPLRGKPKDTMCIQKETSSTYSIDMSILSTHNPNMSTIGDFVIIFPGYVYAF
jgi:hypothetical protein